MSVLYSDIGRFTMAPEWLLDADISDRAVRLFALLGTYADRDTGEAFPGRKLLAERLRCSVDSVDRAIAELCEVGALVVEPRTRADGGKSSNLYRLRYAAPVAAPVPSGVAAPAPRQELEPLLQPDPTANAVGRARGDGSGIVGRKVNRITVTEEEDQLARAVLAEWNQQTGQHSRTKTMLAKIVMRIREHPELAFVDHADLIRRQLEEPWWRETAGAEVIYGNDRVFERTMNVGTGPKKYPRRYGRGMTTREILDVTRGKT